MGIVILPEHTSFAEAYFIPNAFGPYEESDIMKHKIGKHGAVALVGNKYDVCAECGKPIREKMTPALFPKLAGMLMKNKSRYDFEEKYNIDRRSLTAYFNKMAKAFQNYGNMDTHSL